MKSGVNRGAGVLLVSAFALGAALAPCGAWAQDAKTSDVKGLPEHLIVKTAPAGPVLSPLAARKVAKAGEKITITGRVGGGAAPFVKERAVFTIVGDEIPACSDHGMDECPQPWDYCCETKAEIARHSATVQIFQSKGKLLKMGMKGKAGITELTEITVTGLVQVVDEKSLVLVAEEIYVAPALPKGWAFGDLPAASKTPTEAKAAAKVGEEIVVRGRIGGSETPVKPGVASFTLVGPEMAYDEKAEKPWAYTGAVKEALASSSCEVRFVDEKGEPLTVELMGRRGIAPGASVVVTGKVQKLDGGEMVIAASRVQAAKE